MSSSLEYTGNASGMPYFMVIDPGVRTPELDTFNLISSLAPLPCTYQMPAMFGFDAMPSNFDRLHGVIVLGSLASVHDQLPWQKPLEKWLESVINQDIPVLGCCYGFQMLAHMFGGEVAYINADKQKYQGVREVNLLANPLWPVGRRQLMVTHCEQVTHLPHEFQLIATSGEIAIDGFAHKNKPIFGFQAHLEATKLFLNDRQLGSELAFEALKDGHEMIRSFVNMAAKFSW